jgi:hypothetical protein
MRSIVPALVLLVACANAANVLIAYHTARRREFAMRRAIGASRGRLVRQLLAESLVLALLAGLAGFGASFALSTVIVHFGEVPPDFSVLLALDARALLTATIVGVAAVVLFGLAPALTTTRFDVLPVLKDEGTTSTTSRGPGRLRRTLVVAQVALSLTLVVATGLFFQSLSRALRVDPGFDPQGLATVTFDLNLQGYSTDRRAVFVERFVDRASTLPASRRWPPRTSCLSAERCTAGLSSPTTARRLRGQAWRTCRRSISRRSDYRSCAGEHSPRLKWPRTRR